MKKITIDENVIKQTISKVLKEMDLSNIQPQKALFGPIEDEVRSKHAEIMNQIEALENAAMQLDSVIPALDEVDREIKERFPNIQGPTLGQYNEIEYKFAQPVSYDEENDTYGEQYDYIENDIEEMFPKSIRGAVSVSVDYDDDYTYNGFSISIELDELQGWN